MKKYRRFKLESEVYCCIHKALATIPEDTRCLIIPEDHDIIDSGANRYVIVVKNDGTAQIGEL